MTAPDPAPDPAPVPSRSAPVPSLGEIFRAFAGMALRGFGGVLPWARRILVDERRWMTPAEFNELLALGQFLPGPNIVNFSVVFGSRLHGPIGAVVAVTGLVGPSALLVVALGALYAAYGDVEILRRMLSGVAAAAAGLIVALAIKMIEPMVRGSIGFAPFVAIAAFVAVGVLRWPLPPVLAVLAPLSVALAWTRRR